MLILFDLDDTLIQTTSYILPRWIKVLLTRYPAFCSPFSSAEEAKQRLLDYRYRYKSFREAIALFCYDYQIAADVVAKLDFEPDALFLAALGAIPATPGSQEALSFLALHNSLVLVTIGAYRCQLGKMVNANLPLSLFSSMICLKTGDKGLVYSALCDRFSLNAPAVVVCGDRWLHDLLPAERLGIRWVQMSLAQDRHLLDGSGSWAINDMRELITLVDKFNNNGGSRDEGASNCRCSHFV